MTDFGPQDCAKCGACSAVCPVYRQTGREYHTGRGKLHLLSLLDPSAASKTYAEILSHCLLCGACSQVCSRKIPLTEYLAAARAQLQRQAGDHLLLRTLGGKLLAQPLLLKLLAPLLRRLKEHSLPADSGLNLRLGFGLMTEQKAGRPCSAAIKIKSPAAKGVKPPGLDRLLKKSPVDARQGGKRRKSAVYTQVHEHFEPLSNTAWRRPRVFQQPVNSAGRSEDGQGQQPNAYLFSGCYATYIEPAIGQAVLSLLQKSGLSSAQTAAKSGCCGLLAYSSGQVDKARDLARKNIAAHAGIGPIVVACAACANHLSLYPELLAEDPKWHARAQDFAFRVKEFSSLLHERVSELSALASSNDKEKINNDEKTGINQEGKRQAAGTARDQPPLAVLYHDPCHLRFGKLKIHHEPRQLLNLIPQLKLTELPNGPQCCGHGGLFHLAHPQSAAAILEQLVDDFRQTNAEVVTTACTGCLLHWQQAKAEGQHQARVIHLAILLDYLLPKL